MTESKTTAPRRAANGEVPGSLAEALAAFQAKLPKIAKGETGEVKGVSKDNGRPFSYTYKYADLAAVSAAVMPLLGSLGLSFTAKPTLLDGQFVLAYTLRHASGEADEGIYPLPDRGSSQQIGSAITYARRYALLAVTGVAPDSDDDDGAAASQETHRMSRSAGDAWENARPAPQRSQRPNGQPQSAADAWESAAPAQPEQGQTAQVDDPLIGTWAAKLDEITSAQDAEDALAELDREHRGGVIDSRRAGAIKRAIQEKGRQVSGQQAAPRGSSQPKDSNDVQWVREFKAKLAQTPESGLTMARREVGQAVMHRKITPEVANVLTAEVAKRKDELEKAGATA